MIGSIIVGIVAGLIACKLMGLEGQGCLITLLLGLLGGIVGGWIFNLLNLSWGGVVGNIVTSTIGAVVVLWIWSKLKH
jgi:uncharacterized membrane protein YeaQ/YmgE (transglycosylase-associated protein family)